MKRFTKTNPWGDRLDIVALKKRIYIKANGVFELSIKEVDDLIISLLELKKVARREIK